MIVGANRRNFEILFNKNVMWHTSAGMPATLPVNTFDLESRAVHELGHAHLLNHSNNTNDLMYFTDLTPPYRRTIMPNDLAGGLHIVSISSPTAPTGCQASMIPLTLTDCSSVTSTTEVESVFIGVNLFPNPTSEKISLSITNWEDVNSDFLQLSLYDQIGRRVYSLPLDYKEVEIDLSSFLDGLYIITISDSNKVIYSAKLIKD
jgi:hypothetical protein